MKKNNIIVNQIVETSALTYLKILLRVSSLKFDMITHKMISNVETL